MAESSGTPGRERVRSPVPPGRPTGEVQRHEGGSELPFDGGAYAGWAGVSGQCAGGIRDTGNRLIEAVRDPCGSDLTGQSFKRMYERMGTADSLIAAGTELFSARGFEGTSIREITGRAGANLSAVGYHFGSKEGLWHAVLEAGLGPLRDAMSTAASGEGPALDRIERAVRALFLFARAHPELNGLMLHVLASAPPLPPPALQTIQFNSGTMRSLIEEGQREGEIRSGEPRLLALSVASQPLALWLARPALQGSGLIELGSREAFDELVNNAVLFVRAGLAPDPTSRGRESR
jgi:AcrR family transcriptional regulator